MLIEVIERRSPVTNRKSVVYVCNCDACSARIETSACRLKRYPHRQFCDSKCMGRHKREHPDQWPDNGAARNTLEACAKATATKRRKIAAGEAQHPWAGRYHSDETKRRLSETRIERGTARGVNNGMFGRTHGEAARAKMSEAKSRAILAGTFRPYGTWNKKGFRLSTKTGREHFFRSGWEEAVMRHLDALSEVATWDYECVRIPYVYGSENRQRWYVPDFLVSFQDGRSEMWEVKPEQFLQTERVMNTTAAGREYCHSHGMEYVVLTGQILAERGILR